jgi:Holliday junction resolvase RusA-like endonuclease
MKVSFTVYGEPLAQKRPRARIHGKHARVYDDPKSVKAKDTLAVIIQQNSPPRLLAGPLKVDILFCFGRPKSHFGTGRNAGVIKKSAPQYKWNKPDRDNLDKLVLDAMSGIIFHDDAQACDGRLRKIFTDTKPRIEIKVEELEPPKTEKKLFDPLGQLKG